MWPWAQLGCSFACSTASTQAAESVARQGRQAGRQAQERACTHAGGDGSCLRKREKERELLHLRLEEINCSPVKHAGASARAGVQSLHTCARGNVEVRGLAWVGAIARALT